MRQRMECRDRRAAARASSPAASTAASAAHRFIALCKPGSGVRARSNTGCASQATAPSGDMPAVGTTEHDAARMRIEARHQFVLARVHDQRLRYRGKRELVGGIAFARAVPVEVLFVQIVDHADLDRRRIARLETGQLPPPTSPAAAADRAIRAGASRYCRPTPRDGRAHAKRCAIKALTVLLPLVPVTAITRASGCSANHSAVPAVKCVPACSASSTSGR